MAALLTGVLAADRRWGIVVAPPDGGPAVKVDLAVRLRRSAGRERCRSRGSDRERSRGRTRRRPASRSAEAFLSGVDNAWFACGGVDGRTGADGVDGHVAPGRGPRSWEDTPGAPAA